MLHTQKLKTRIKELQTQKTELNNELNRLKQQLAAKASNLEQQKDVECPLEEIATIK